MKLRVVLIACVVFFAAQVFSQTTAASCSSFTYFVPPSPYNAAFEAWGVNAYGTVVGQASSTTTVKAFVRTSAGGISLYSVPGEKYTALYKRNSAGTSVGYYANSAGATGLIYTSSSHASLKYPSAYSTVAYGINKYNTIVGSFQASAYSDQMGFRYSGGKFTKIHFPNSVQTVATAVNNSGMIVGQYTLGNLENPPHGFIYKGGVYTTLDAPGGNSMLWDINNNGTVVASPNLIYIGGKWKAVVVPRAYETMINGVNDKNEVTGVANYPSSGGNYTWKAFTAICH